VKVLGIDPGLKGALGFVDLSDDGAEILGVEVFDMPTSEFVDGRPVPCPRGVRRLLDELRPDLVILEHVESRPGSGSVSEWRFASGFGAVLAVCQTAFGADDARVHLVRPRLWKEKMGLSSDKSASLDLARVTFVSQLMLRCDRDGNLLPPKILKKGDAVTLTKGPFAGFTATIEGMAPERRIWLLLEMMGHNMCVSARSSDLRAA
jgi:hypothetical protein